MYPFWRVNQRRAVPASQSSAGYEGTQLTTAQLAFPLNATKTRSPLARSVKAGTSPSSLFLPLSPATPSPDKRTAFTCAKFEIGRHIEARC